MQNVVALDVLPLQIVDVVLDLGSDFLQVRHGKGETILKNGPVYSRRL